MSGRRRGFSYIELLASLAIIALLLGVAVPVLQTVTRRHAEMELRHELFEIRDAIDRYKRDYDAGRLRKQAGASGYPPSLAALVEGAEDVGSPTRERLYYLRRIPANPLLPGRADGWGLRSYASPPDAPAEGEDVFDVYCPCEGSGLDGVPYREW